MVITGAKCLVWGMELIHMMQQLAGEHQRGLPMHARPPERRIACVASLACLQDVGHLKAHRLLLVLQHQVALLDGLHRATPNDDSIALVCYRFPEADVRQFDDAALLTIQGGPRFRSEASDSDCVADPEHVNEVCGACREYHTLLDAGRRERRRDVRVMLGERCRTLSVNCHHAGICSGCQ